MDFVKAVSENYEYTVKLRRYFHENPECGPAEQEGTMKKIEQELDDMNIRHVRIPNGGVFGFIDGAREGKTVLLRSDIDALPIEENENNLSGKKVCVSKKKGVMHGCGHDAHIAMLLTAGKILKEMADELEGHIILMFEQGEEGYLNIVPMCRAIQEMHLKIDTCYATHVRWDVPAGKLVCCPKISMSGIHHYELNIYGEGGHGSRPDLAKSPIDCYHEIYNIMLGLRMKYVRPDSGLTWSVGYLHAGSAFNVIPDHLECAGSIRSMDIEAGEEFWKEFKKTIDEICKLYYCKSKIECKTHFLPLINHESCRQLFLKSVEQYLGKDAIDQTEPWMASESYCYLTCMYPSVHTFTGIRNEEVGSGANHHTPEFDIDEKGMVPGITAAVAYAVEFLKNPPDVSDFKPLCNSMEELIVRLADV